MVKQWGIVIGLLLVLWGTRLAGLEALPMHNDEGLHVRRAVEVWHGHPFFAISDGKIINHWLIAALVPQDAPVFAGRVATLLTAMLGCAAGIALARKEAGWRGALLAGALWIAVPYLYFFERMALSDAQAGAWIVVAAWATVRFTASGRLRYAVYTGIALALATLFKLTAAPFALTIGILLLTTGTLTWRQRLSGGAIIAGIVLASFAVPLIYLVATGGDFGIALAWLDTTNDSGEGLALLENLKLLGDQLIHFGVFGWMIPLVGGLIALMLPDPMRPTLRRRGILMLSLALPLLALLVLGSNARPRHFVVALPLAITLAGVGWGWSRIPGWLTGAMAAALVAYLVIFARVAISDPGDLRLPDDVRAEYITSHAAGFGVVDAVRDFPTTIGDPGPVIIASMFPDSCRRANFYDTRGYAMICGDAPGLKRIQTALQRADAVYVLAEAPPIGLDFAQTDWTTTLIATYPRPGETAESNSAVRLWRVTP